MTTQELPPPLLARLRSARRIVFLTGAGLSAESGIPTFREANGSLWRSVDPMVVASFEGFSRNPEAVWAWHESMRRRFGAARPNAGHEALALLEMRLQPAQVQIITQNVDGLHQEAGNTCVLEIHGTAQEIRCHRRCGYRAAWNDGALRRCPICGAATRPDLVWFGENLDPARFSLAQEMASRADVFFSVGTSGVVQPAAGLPLLAHGSGALLVEVNPAATPLSEQADYSVRASVSEFFPALCEAVRALKLRQVR